MHHDRLLDTGELKAFRDLLDFIWELGDPFLT